MKYIIILLLFISSIYCELRKNSESTQVIDSIDNYSTPMPQNEVQTPMISNKTQTQNEENAVNGDLLKQMKNALVPRNGDSLSKYIKNKDGVDYVQIQCVSLYNYYLNTTSNQISLIKEKCVLAKPLAECRNYDNSENVCNSKDQCIYSNKFKRCISKMKNLGQDQKNLNISQVLENSNNSKQDFNSNTQQSKEKNNAKTFVTTNTSKSDKTSQRNNEAQQVTLYTNSTFPVISSPQQGVKLNLTNVSIADNQPKKVATTAAVLSPISNTPSSVNIGIQATSYESIPILP